MTGSALIVANAGSRLISEEALSTYTIRSKGKAGDPALALLEAVA